MRLTWQSDIFMCFPTLRYLWTDATYMLENMVNNVLLSFQVISSVFVHFKAMQCHKDW